MVISNWNFISVFRNFLCLNNFIKFRLKEEMQHKFTILQVCISSSCAVKCFVQLWRRNTCLADGMRRQKMTGELLLVSHWQKAAAIRHNLTTVFCLDSTSETLHDKLKVLERCSPSEYILTAVLTGGPWIYSDKLMQFYCCRCSQFW